jgi:hypothetical protein
MTLGTKNRENSMVLMSLMVLGAINDFPGTKVIDGWSIASTPKIPSQ